MDKYQFMPGLDLNRLFFQQIIKPLMEEHFPDIQYSAGILGEGSDVLRFDTPQSMDHNWGPHMRIFLREQDFRKRDEIYEMFRHKLPYEFMGFPTNFTKPNEDAYLVTQMKPVKSGPVNPMIEFFTITSFWKHFLGFDPYQKITHKDWLTFPQQSLIEVTSGEVYYDGLNELEKMRDKFRYYPDDIWLYMLQMQWGYIAGIEVLMARSGDVGDELGSSVIAGQIVNHVMRLLFLMEKTYWPYPKWFGTAFTRLKCAHMFTHRLMDVMHSKDWREREERLGIVYELLLEMHNQMKITRKIKLAVSDFEGRPYKILQALEVYKEIGKKVKPRYQKFKYNLGSVDQFTGHSKINHINYVYREMTTIIK
jgi:hypothetical protein